MNIFQNLCPHETILLILGVVMFCVLIFGLVWNIIKERKIGILLPFFLIPIVMIGYPSIGSIQYEEGKFHLQPLIGQLMDRNLSEDELVEFINAYETIAQSCKSNHDPEAQATLAQAHFATGNFEEARVRAERSLSLQPQNRVAQEIQQKSSEQIQRVDEFNSKINQLERLNSSIESGNSNRNGSFSQLTEILSDIRLPQNIESDAAIILAKSLAYTGKEESASNLIDQVLQKPSLTREETRRAREIQTRIQSTPSEDVQLQVEPEQQPEMNINPELSPEIMNQQRIKTNISRNNILNH